MTSSTVKFSLQYRGCSRTVPIHRACLSAARARYAALQNEPCYVAEQWTPSQWGVLCASFELYFSMASVLTTDARFCVERRVDRQRARVFLPVGFSLAGTLFLENFRVEHPRASAQLLQKALQDAPLFGDARFPAVRYCQQLFVLPANFAVPAIEPLFALLAASDVIHAGFVPLAFFQVLWKALQTQFAATSQSPPFHVVFQQRRSLVPAHAALSATLALASALFTPVTDVDADATWSEFRAAWDPCAGFPGQPFDPLGHSAASAPAALAPRVFPADSAPALCLPSSPDSTLPWLCRFCGASFPDRKAFDAHVADLHACKPTSYPALLHTALSQAFPSPADPLVLRRLLATYRTATAAVWTCPSATCACCATMPSAKPCDVFDLRSPVFDLPRLHDFFSARAYLQRYQSRLPSNLPASFVGLTFADLEPTTLPAPCPLREDRWILYLPPSFRQSWLQAAPNPAQALSVPLCTACHRSLVRPRVALPATALANDNLHVGFPAALQDLTPAELLFISRGYTHCRLITLPSRGAPETRQRALLGNVVSFPQNAASVVSSLPQSTSAVNDALAVFFPPDGAPTLARCPQFLVRRSRVAAAIGWLQKHNPQYADVTVDHAALAALPEHDIPSSLLAAARVLPQSLSADAGPADATSGDAAVHSLSAAILDTEGEATHPLARWEQALTAATDAVDTLAAADPDPVLVAAHIANASDAMSNLLPADPTAEPPPAFAAIVPHGNVPLSAFDPAYWTLVSPICFHLGSPLSKPPGLSVFSTHIGLDPFFCALTELSFHGIVISLLLPSALPSFIVVLSCALFVRRFIRRGFIAPFQTYAICAPSISAGSSTFLATMGEFRMHCGIRMSVQP